MRRIYCNSCIFWDQDEGDPEGEGYCHRHPPRVLRKSDGNIVSQWPVTTGNDFCGDAITED